jgi:hypothetical protein
LAALGTANRCFKTVIIEHKFGPKRKEIPKQNRLWPGLECGPMPIHASILQHKDSLRMRPGQFLAGNSLACRAGRRKVGVEAKSRL